MVSALRSEAGVGETRGCVSQRPVGVADPVSVAEEGGGEGASEGCALAAFVVVARGRVGPGVNLERRARRAAALRAVSSRRWAWSGEAGALGAALSPPPDVET